jgi:AcrR family transcriptional regulator
VSETRPTSANRILETALDLFATQGYDGTSVQAICDAARITKPTLYHFYGSKEGVYSALIATALERVRRSLFTALAQEGPLVERLKLVVRDLFADATADPKLWRFMSTSVWMPGTAPVETAHCTYAEYGTLIADAIESAVRRGELTPGPTAVRVLVLKGAVGEALDSFVLFEEPDLTPELADQLVDAVFGGWLATPAAATESAVTNAASSPTSPAEPAAAAAPGVTNGQAATSSSPQGSRTHASSSSSSSQS